MDPIHYIVNFRLWNSDSACRYKISKLPPSTWKLWFQYIKIIINIITAYYIL